ncbi:MAG: NAD(P)H-hydrate dehydratase [Patescibacteria group bacterium]
MLFQKKNLGFSTNGPIPPELRKIFLQIKLPSANSHKGQNGKLMIIGGSELFHAASKWSLDIASRFVDMVFYSSVPSNNQLIQTIKANFWNGIVIPREKIEDYINEADCVLIGPGMERSPETQELCNKLIKKFDKKKWVIDAGALQMLDPSLVNEQQILTPHPRELSFLAQRSNLSQQTILNDFRATVLLKGPTDQIFFHKGLVRQQINIFGGNPGMTKGGTGDVLAGLIAGLYTNNEALTSTILGSFVSKKAGDYLHSQVGPFFNASDMVQVIPSVLWKTLQEISNH